MTSFGKTVLRYMVSLKPALEARGFEVAVFHATGMGGRAFESLAAEGAFAAVMDFAPQELGNHIMGSAISAGPDRLTAAGKAGIPQIVAPGCYDLVDLVGWHALPERFKSHEVHAHNRLLSSILLDAGERREVAQRDLRAAGAGHRPDRFPAADPGLQRMGPARRAAARCRRACRVLRRNPARLPAERHAARELPTHINDAPFSDAALAVLGKQISPSGLPAFPCRRPI
jgi:uncharacterized protein (UPF0261 family)